MSKLDEQPKRSKSLPLVKLPEPVDAKLRQAIRGHVHFLIHKPEYQPQLGRGKYPSDSEDLLVAQLIQAMREYVDQEVQRELTLRLPQQDTRSTKKPTKSKQKNTKENHV